MHHKPFPCPKCTRLLPPSGELAFGGDTFLTYQCDECLVSRDVFGETMDLPFTFYVDKAGRPVDATEK